MKKMLMKTLLASLFAGAMANAQDAAEIKKIAAQDLPKNGDWAMSVEKGWKAERSIANAWTRKGVNVLQVIVPGEWEWDMDGWRRTNTARLKHSIVYKNEKGDVYYTTGLTGVNKRDLWGDTVEVVDDVLPSPEYLVEGFELGRNVDLASLKSLSKKELPANSAWASGDGNNVMGAIVSNWKLRGVEALEARSTNDNWVEIKDSQGNGHNHRSVKYNLVYKANDVVYYATGLTAYYSSFWAADVGYAPLLPEAIVPDFILTAAQLDTMKTMSMDLLPSCDSISPLAVRGFYSDIYDYARYNINEDVVQIYPKNSDWVNENGVEMAYFDMIHKNADGKVVFTYGYKVTRTDAKEFTKAKAWKQKMHEVEVADWNEDTWKRSVKDHPLVEMCAKRRYKTKSELPKEGMKDAATIKQLTKLAKENYPGLKKIIVRNTTPEVSKNFFGKIIKRVILFDVIYEKKTNVSKKIYVKEQLIVEQKHDGKSYEKNWSNRGYSVWNDTYARGMFDDSEYNITDWK